MIDESKTTLSNDGLIEVLLILSDNQRQKEMTVFLEETKIKCPLKIALRCMKYNCYGNFSIEVSERLYNITDMFLQGLSESSRAKLLFEVSCLAIDSPAIHLFEKLVSREDFPVFDEKQLEIIHKRIAKQDDRIARDYFEYYMEKRVIKQSYEYYYVDGWYNPNSNLTSEEYFEYDAWNNCQYYLKEYRKKKLLNPETTKKKLMNFFDQEYNWDDGVDIPYFVLKHPNCDLELKKYLLEEFGDKDYYRKDEVQKRAKMEPEIYFWVLLDKMIEDEEQANK